MNLAVSNGRLHDHDLVVLHPDMIRDVLAFGHLKLLQYVTGRFDPSQWRTYIEMQTALSRDHFEMAEWLYVNGLAGKFTSYNAARVGYLESLKEALEEPKREPGFVKAVTAGKCGNFDVFEWILHRNPSMDSLNRIGCHC